MANPSPPLRRNVQDELNRSSPAADHAKLGNVLADLVAQVNAQRAVITALVAKLNADAGVTDTNYSAVGLAEVKTLDRR